ncbi:MAG: hypothetical protein GY941_17800 [Planctomycetes bacterium]|nr:hypothetical protein [Planctomycetota bacterium]
MKDEKQPAVSGHIEPVFDLYVEGYGNTYEQAINALSKQMKFVESKSEVEWSNDILAFGSGEMGHKTHHKYRILKANQHCVYRK